MKGVFSGLFLFSLNLAVKYLYNSEIDTAYIVFGSCLWVLIWVVNEYIIEIIKNKIKEKQNKKRK